MFITIGNASTVDVKLDEEHQVIRGFGGMVHNQWQNGGGLSDADAKLAFGTGEGTIGLNTLRIPVYASSNDFNKEVAAAKSAKKYAGDDFGWRERHPRVGTRCAGNVARRKENSRDSSGTGLREPRCRPDSWRRYVDFRRRILGNALNT